LSKKGAQLLVDTIDGLEEDTIHPKPQPELASDWGAKAPKIKPANLRIDWQAPASRIMNQIRAFSPSPGAVTHLAGKRLKLFDSTTGEGAGPPGQVLNTTGGHLEIATGDGSLLVSEVQIEGRRRLPVTEFLRGFTLATGEMLG
ncbi:MAG: methionyl-tRNA formyltransferase, partial [Candidatus Neomarinimicrobiota bacterium]